MWVKNRICTKFSLWKPVAKMLCKNLHPLQNWWLPNLHKMCKFGNYHFLKGCKPLRSCYLQQVCTRQTLCKFDFNYQGTGPVPNEVPLS